MVNQSALASEVLVSERDSAMDAAAGLWAVVQAAEMLPATPETRDRLAAAHVSIQRQIDRFGWKEADLRAWILNKEARERPPDADPRLHSV